MGVVCAARRVLSPDWLVFLEHSGCRGVWDFLDLDAIRATCPGVGYQGSRAGAFSLAAIEVGLAHLRVAHVRAIGSAAARATALADCAGLAFEGQCRAGCSDQECGKQSYHISASHDGCPLVKLHYVASTTIPPTVPAGKHFRGWPRPGVLRQPAFPARCRIATKRPRRRHNPERMRD